MNHSYLINPRYRDNTSFPYADGLNGEPHLLEYRDVEEWSKNYTLGHSLISLLRLGNVIRWNTIRNAIWLNTCLHNLSLMLQEQIRQETNYLDPQSLKDMIDCLLLVVDYNTIKKTNPDGIPNAEELKKLAWIEYYCALRVTEALSLQPEDFDLEGRILTLNHTKTGFKRCNKCKGKGGDCPKCEGKGKIRKKQFTTIPPKLMPIIQDWIKTKPPGQKIFPWSRQLIWSYYKKAGKFAQLNIAEQQDERTIKGVWTHLLRKSYAKWMLDKGAKEVLIKVKLRHKFTITERYTRPDINALLQWEKENA